MESLRKISIAGFILVALLEILSLIFAWQTVHHFAKPLLMVLLCLYYYFSASPQQRVSVVILALVFSFLGDSFLLYENKNPLYFILGLASFLVAHVFYILAFRQHRFVGEPDGALGIQKARMAFPVILAVTGLVIVLFPHLDDLRMPVVLYAVVLMFMVLNALFRFRQTSANSYWSVFGGALLFLVSDSLIAINRFLEPVYHAGPIIMITYILAQYLIIDGLVRHQKSFVGKHEA